MANTLNYILPEQQNAGIQIGLEPPTSISGWSISVDLMYRMASPQPIVTLYLASGYSHGESGITLVDGSVGIFNAAYGPTQVSGLSLQTNVLAYKSYRTDTGVKTPLNGGFRLLSIF